MATLAASVLTLLSLGSASLALWRIGTDLSWAGAFVFSGGLLSHWQVWAGAAIAIQYLAFRLTRHARIAQTEAPMSPAEEAVEEVGAPAAV
ncbi:MAG: hypothetical protein M3N93_11405 [Acidobacteriota bacterium]|nr:hypothetical protein [Acidobacteriota bacterium]